MCGHRWKKINSVFVCMKCGVEYIAGENIILFDRELPNYKRKRRKK